MDYIGAHWDPQGKHEHAHSRGEKATVLQQSLGVVVHQSGYQSFYVAKLGIDTKNLKAIYFYIQASILLNTRRCVNLVK